MKTLIIIRHAKAEQNFGKDSDRKLTEKGRANAVFMAQKLAATGYTIDKIFSSPAVRTAETAKLFADVLHIDEKNLKYFDKLYLGDTLAIEETIEWLQENINTLAIVGHNPGVTNFIKDMTGTIIEDLPTCGIAIIKAAIDEWSRFEEGAKTIVDIFSPKDF